MTTTSPDRTAPHTRQHLQALYIGLALTVLVGLAPLADVLTVDTIAGHVGAAYPEWTAEEVTADRTAIAGSLIGIAVAGALCWLAAIRAARRGRGARATTTALFAVGTTLALTVLGMGGAEYDRIVPLGYGLAGLVPCLAGLAAVLTVWRRTGP